jgi:hypothetical protein
MVTVMKNRTTDVRIFFSELVDFASLGGAFRWSKQFFSLDFPSGPAKHAEFTAGPSFDRRIKNGLAKPYYKSRL